jgi:hypothetical protein
MTTKLTANVIHGALGTDFVDCLCTSVSISDLSTIDFSNCVIFVNVESISVIIETQEQLNADEIAQIQNIISREMSAEVENIHIMTK